MLLFLILLLHIDILIYPIGKYASGFEITDLIYYINIRQYVVDRILNGIFPLWTTKLFCGVPFFANSETAVLYIPNIMFFLTSISKAINLSFILHFFVLAFSSFLWINNKIKDKFVAIPVAMISVFGTNLYLHFSAGHLSNVITACWFPLLLYFYDKTFEKKSYFYILPISFVISLQVFAGHFQYVYYTALVSFIYILFFCRNKYTVVTILLSYFFSLFLTAIQLLPSYDFYMEGARKINIFDTNASPIYSEFRYQLSLVFYIYTYLSSEVFWETSNYIGTLNFLIILMALVHVRNKDILKNIFVVLLLSALSFQMFSEMADKIIPFFSWFRGTVKLNFFVDILMLPILATGIKFILSKKLKINKVFLLCLFLFAILIFLFKENILSLLLSNMYTSKSLENIISRSIVITASLIFMLSICLLFKKYTISRIIIILLIVFEPVIVTRTHLKPLILKQDFKYEYITKEPFNEQPRFSAYKNFNLLYGAENISGLFSDRLGFFGIFNKKIYNTQNENISVLLRSKYDVDLRTGSIKKSDNKTLNRINLYYSCITETDKNKIYEMLCDKNFDIFNTVILEKESQYKLGAKGEYSLNILNFKENSIDFEVDTTEPAIVLYTDNYSKGWKAYEIHNPKQRYEIICADYLYKAISVDKGKHKIRIEYKPIFFIVGLWISVSAWIIFLFFFALLHIRKRYKVKHIINDRKNN